MQKQKVYEIYAQPKGKLGLGDSYSFAVKATSYEKAKQKGKKEARRFYRDYVGKKFMVEAVRIVPEREVKKDEWSIKG